MELNLKILAPLRQCTSKNRCALVIRRKNIYIILITRWIKIMPLIQSLSLSFSLSLSSLNITLSLSLPHSGLSLSHSLTPVSHSLTSAGLSLSHSLNSDHPSPQSTPSADPARRRDRCLLVMGFFFFYAMDWWWWWWWWWLWPWLRKKIGDFGFFFFAFVD